MGEEQAGNNRGIERRKVERRHLVFYLRVFEGMSTHVVGHLVDVSTKGAMLISDDPIPVDATYHLRMRLPSGSANREELLFTASSKWCRQDVNPDFYITGFEIHDLNPETARYIHDLIDDFSFNEPA